MAGLQPPDLDQCSKQQERADCSPQHIGRLPMPLQSPSAQPSPYSPAELEARKLQLQTRLAELSKRLTAIERDLEERPEQDWDEAALDAENNEVREGLGHVGLREMEAIRAALQRIENGTYGICVHSGEVISRQRLDTIPWTPFCEKHAR
jgi:RNA polymerase-binding transcription factor DksA